MKKKKNYNLIVGIGITGFFFLMAVIGQFWTPYGSTDMNSAAVGLAPCLMHPMGTDNFGRDILSRVMSGSGSTFFVAVCTVLIGGVCGTLVGAVTGYFGGWIDNVVMRISDILLSFPSILLALIFISFMGPGKYNIILALGILFIPSFARIVRSEVIRFRELDFVKSAKIMGAGDFRIIFAHILPNALVSILTAAAIGFNNAVLAEASMSYLGLGVQPPEASLGRMLSEAQSYLFNMPWYAIFPGIAIILIILGFSMVSEGLRSMQE
ncbi:MAG: ABC transporter permease [Clostridium sp.]